MSIVEPTRLVLVESSAALERLLDDTSVEVEFESQAAEQLYQEADWRLHCQICDVMGVTDSPTRSDGLVFVLDDWWPNRTKLVQADVKAFGPDQVKALRALLQGEFEDWRIVVGIFRGHAGSNSVCIGGLCIDAVRTLVSREVLHVVTPGQERM
jgi:hypothetical protein